MTQDQEEKRAELVEQYSEGEVAAYEALGIGDDDFSDFEEARQGQFSSDEEFAKEIAESTGEMPKDMQWPMYCIDWEFAARELMMDYSEQDGFYFRNL